MQCARGVRRGRCERRTHLDDDVAAVDALRVWQQQAQLLDELREPAAGVARRREQDLGVLHARARVLVVDVRLHLCAPTHPAE